MKSISVGIDISKDTLDVCIKDGEKVSRGSYPNTKPGIAKLLGVLPAGSEVQMESTGGYERLPKRMLAEAGFAVRVHNPRRVRRFADAQGVSAKTDSLDAGVLADASVLRARTISKSPDQEALCDLSRLIQSLKKELSGHKKRLSLPCRGKSFEAAVKKLVRTREKEIESLEKEYVKLVKSSSRAQSYELAQTVPCVGPMLARSLSSELPDGLDGWSPRTIASYAGLAPLDHASGKSAKASRIGPHGNIHLKAALYMPAMAAVQRLDWARSLYSKLRSKGRSHRQSIVAVMRRLLIRILAVLKRGSAWMPEPPNLT